MKKLSVNAVKVRNWICAGILLIALGFTGGVIFQNNRLAGALGPDNMALINAAADIVKGYSINEYSREEITDMMLDGLAAGIEDDYSQYFTPEELVQHNDDKQGIIKGGIGVLIEMQEGEAPLISEVYEDSPAAKAGLQAGDRLTMVNEEDVSSATIERIQELVAGEVGTELQVTVRRGDQLMGFTLARAIVVRPMVRYRKLEAENLMYIHILSFNGNAVELFGRALTEAEAQGMAGLVIDLRDNLGGDLGILVSILDKLLPEGEVFYAKDRFGNKISSQYSGASATNLPFVTLVNNMSASASEAFAGAVRDFGVSKLVGIKTYGKGIMQTTYNLPNSGAFKLTVAEYYLPKGESIHKIGITPEYFVELPGGVTSRPADMADAEDTQLQKGISLLKGQ